MGHLVGLRESWAVRRGFSTGVLGHFCLGEPSQERLMECPRPESSSVQSSILFRARWGLIAPITCGDDALGEKVDEDIEQNMLLKSYLPLNLNLPSVAAASLLSQITEPLFALLFLFSLVFVLVMLKGNVYLEGMDGLPCQ